jgi:hypothetical protein
MPLLYHEIHDCQGQNQDNLTPLDKRDQAWYDKSMDKIKLITLVIRKKDDGIYEHLMMPSGTRTQCTSAASSGYMSGALSILRAIKPLANIVAAIVTPWDDDAGTYEVCVSASYSAFALLGQDFLAQMRQNGFLCQKWPEEYEFWKIIQESEISLVLGNLKSEISRFNEQ